MTHAYTAEDRATLAEQFAAAPRAGRSLVDTLNAQGDKSEIEATRQRWLSSLPGFLKEAIPLTFGPDYGDSEFFRAMFGVLRRVRDAKRSIKAVFHGPRGHVKSKTLCYGLPACVALEPERYGTRYVLVGKARYELARREVDALGQELAENLAIREVYGDIRGRVWNKGELETTTGVRIEAIGADQAVRGLTWTTHEWGSHRPGILLLDDIDKDAASQAVRDSMLTWVEQAAIGLAGVGHPLHILMAATAIDNQTVAWRLAQKWTSLLFAALTRLPDALDEEWSEWGDIYDSDQTPDRDEAFAFYEANREVMDAGAERLWCAEPLYDLMEYRHIAPGAFAAEKQNDPRDSASALIPAGTIQHWGEAGDRFEDEPVVPDRILCVDPSMGKQATKGKRAGDWQALIGGGRVSGWSGIAVLFSKLLRLPVIEDPSDPKSRNNLVRAIADAIDKIHATRCLVESVAFQEVLQPLLRAELVRRGITYCVVRGWDVGPVTNKAMRLRQLEGPIKLGQLITSRAHAGLNDQIEALRQNGTSRDHDDGPDALQMLNAHLSVRHMATPKHIPGDSDHDSSVGDFGAISGADLFGGGGGDFDGF